MTPEEKALLQARDAEIERLRRLVDNLTNLAVNPPLIAPGTVHSVPDKDAEIAKLKAERAVLENVLCRIVWGDR